MIVAQVSDIHAANGNDNLRLLDRALSWLGSIKPDALVVSGDLVDDGWAEGYEEIAARFEVLPYPVFVLPGNADNRGVMRDIFTSSNANMMDQYPSHFVAEVGDVRLIGIDTTIAGSAAGDVSEHLPWLGETLKTGAFPASLLFMHHHVFRCGIEPLDAVMCRGTESLQKLLEGDHPQPLAILTGHVHRPMTGMLGAIPAHICGSICEANPLWLRAESIPPICDPSMLMVHRVDEGVLVSSHVSV